jgi:hypothetical protein
MKRFQILLYFLMVGCSAIHEISGQYHANFQSQDTLTFYPPSHCEITSRGKKYPGTYSINGNHLSLTLNSPFINERSKQIFEIEDDRLVAIDDNNQTGIYLPGGSVFSK